LQTGQRPARICDISCGGVKLASSCRLPLGTALRLHVNGADELAPRALTAEVVHDCAQSDGRWVMGCRLINLMSEKELARLLSLYQGRADADEPLIAGPVHDANRSATCR
jgi:PilZ domain